MKVFASIVTFSVAEELFNLRNAELLANETVLLPLETIV